MKKTTKGARRSVRRAKRDVSEAAQKGQGAVRELWNAAVEAFNDAEKEAEHQINALLKSGRLTATEARDTFESFSKRMVKERKKVMRDLEHRIESLQDRIEKERKSIGKTVDETVRGALAAFNIPSRREVSELTRKVEELSAKIDGFRRGRATANKSRTTRGRATTRRASHASAA